MTDQSATGPAAAPADHAKRTRLVETAAAEFSRVGFDRAAVETIAAAAGVAKGTVYLYFESKEDLFLAVLDELKRQLADAVDEVPEASGMEAIGHFVRAHLRLADNAPDLFRCYTSALYGVNRAFQSAALQTFEWQAAQLDRLVRRQHVRGSVRTLTKRDATLISGYINTTALMRGLAIAPDKNTRHEERLLMTLFGSPS